MVDAIIKNIQSLHSYDVNIETFKSFGILIFDFMGEPDEGYFKNASVVRTNIDIYVMNTCTDKFSYN